MCLTSCDQAQRHQINLFIRILAKTLKLIHKTNIFNIFIISWWITFPSLLMIIWVVRRLKKLKLKAGWITIRLWDFSRHKKVICPCRNLLQMARNKKKIISKLRCYDRLTIGAKMARKFKIISEIVYYKTSIYQEILSISKSTSQVISISM